MRRAYEAVTCKKMGVNRASLEIKVPHTVLKDRVSLKMIHGCDIGQSHTLSTKKRKSGFLVEML